MSARLHTVSDDTRPAVEVHGLGKTYPGGVEAVRGIDFQVAPGEVFGLLGPNGAGKSTTIGMLTTTIEPTSGSARLAGFDVVRHPIAARRGQQDHRTGRCVRAVRGDRPPGGQLQRRPAAAPGDRPGPGLRAEGAV